MPTFFPAESSGTNGSTERDKVLKTLKPIKRRQTNRCRAKVKLEPSGDWAKAENETRIFFGNREWPLIQTWMGRVLEHGLFDHEGHEGNESLGDKRLRL